MRIDLLPRAQLTAFDNGTFCYELDAQDAFRSKRSAIHTLMID